MKKRVKIISEIAQGFEGDFKTADLLLDSCINSRADIIKFQLNRIILPPHSINLIIFKNC